jgi:nucleotide-binding universal stress UspA family protein
MTRVLIGTDGSALARRAAERARGVLDIDEVLVVSIVQPVLAGALPVGPNGGYLTSGLEDPDLTEQRHSEAAAIAADLAATFPTATTRVLDGEPGPELCRLAEDEAVGVIVVGSHGAGFLRRVLLGSVSHYLLQHAPCPVLVVRRTDDDAEMTDVTG